MRKITFFLMFVLFASVLKANDEVMLTMTAEPGKTLDFSIYFAEPSQTLNVDWGDGQLKPYENIASDPDVDWATTVTGTVSGDGTVTLYAAPGQLTSFEAMGSVSGSKISAIDLSKVTNLTSLTLSSHALTSVDVSGLTQLTTLYLNNNQLTSVDLSKNTLVTTLHLEGNQLASVDLSAQTKVSTLYLSDNSTLSEIVWPSGNSSLKNVYVLNLVGMTGTLDLSAYPSLSYVSANGSHYTAIDVRGTIPASLFCTGSEVSAIYADSVKTTLNCTGSRMTPATLPRLSPKNYNYAPLAAYELSEDIKAGEALDLSGLVSAGDEATYTWKYANGTPVPADSYKVESGVTTFTTALDSAVYCEITSTLFPKLSGDNAYKTTPVNVVSGETPAPEVMLTMTAEPGKTLDFSIYFAEPSQTLNVDWGDGQLKPYENIASDPDVDWATTVTGTVSGDGTVTLYAAPGQLTSFEAMGSVSGSKISAIDLSKVTNLTSLTLSSHALTSVDVSGLTQLTTLYLNNNQLTSVDLSKNTLVTTLHLEGNQLASVDLSAQTKVSTLYLSDNSTLSEIVWPSGNSSLKNVYVLNLVGMTGTLDLSAYPSLSYVSANGSHYTAIDVRGTIPASLFCTGSEVSAIYADSVKTTLNCTGSRMTPATLPRLSPKNYNYAPLAAYELSEDIKAGEALDLSGLVSAGDEATYTWKYANGTPVPADSYKVESGVTTFTTALDSAVYCEITSTLFPKLSGDNAYKTTEIKVLATSTSIDETEASAEIRFYALSGRIVVENVAAGTPVAVYSLSGVKCAEVVSAEGKATLEVPQGYYIVVAGTTARQVIVP